MDFSIAYAVTKDGSLLKQLAEFIEKHYELNDELKADRRFREIMDMLNKE